MATAAALAFAGKSVATPAISFLVNKAFTYLNKYRKVEGMGELEDRILLALPKIQAVFDVVNPGRIKEQSIPLDKWLWKLRDAVEEADDAVDEVEYYELEEKSKDRKVSDLGSSFAKMKHKAVKSVKHSSIVDKAIKGSTYRGTLKRLRKALEGLDKAAADVEKFLALADRLRGHNNQQEEGSLRETGSMITTTEVFGRDKEKELAIGWLTKTSGEDAEILVTGNPVPLVSIVGHGGMGKTTLAQLICQDAAVTNHFDKVIWACVSTSFDARAVISKILESASLEKPSANSLDALQKILREELNSVKFLLILDDVWEDKKDDQWKNLFAPLKTGRSGSKILLTTRMQSVANMAASTMRGPAECLQLHGLEENESIKLFCHHAFPSGGLQDCPALQPIGEQIANKVRGCPLVTKVVASHLRDNLTFQYWNNFLHQGLEHFEGSADDIMNVLKLSYYHLPTEMQSCFRYCSIFPQDYKFKKNKLVEIWMSSGLISQAEDGENILAELSRKSFFDLGFKRDDLGRVKEESGRYVMHDLIHDLAKNVSLGECARIVDVASLENVPSTVRHIYVEDINPVEKIKKPTCLKSLRTIIINMDHNPIIRDVLNTIEEIVQSSKSLRLFQTNIRHTSHFLGKLAELKHLRFVKLKRYGILPESIWGIVKLYHLTTLDWYIYHGKIEPKQLRAIGNLDRLQYVEYGSKGLGKFPVARLISLRALNHYCIKGVKGYTISALKNLSSLRRLSLLRLESVTNNPEEAKEAKLKEKLYLESLSLEWSEAWRAQSSTDESILDNFEPHDNLKELSISGFSGTVNPRWIATSCVKNLVTLELKRWRECEQLVSLEKLLTLKNLKLEHLGRLKRIGYVLNVSGEECIGLFLPPSLQTLVVEECPKLGELPLLPPSLMSLIIYWVGLTKLPRIGLGELHNGNAEAVSSQLQCIYVRDLEHLTSLEGSLFEQKEYMGVLRELRIFYCAELESAPLSFEEMNVLQKIDIRGCPKFRGAEDKLLPSSLRDIHLEECGDMVLGSLQGLTNLTELYLENCSAVESLPSADVFQSLRSLRDMHLLGCKNLSSLGGLGSLPYLINLRIRNCCKLVEAGRSVTLDASGGEEGHPVVSLQIDRFEFNHPSILLVEPFNSLCHTKEVYMSEPFNRSLPHVCLESLPKRWLLQNCTSVTTLMLEECSAVRSLPSADVFQNLRSLRKMRLIYCWNLSSLGGLGFLPSLSWLEIKNCRKLVEAGMSVTLDASGGEEGHPVVSLQIDRFDIDHPSILLVEPLNSLCHTKQLNIDNESEMQSLPERWLLQNRTSLQSLDVNNARSLESLPPSIRDLSSLESLTLHVGRQLRSLPDLPSSLESLTLEGAWQLRSLPDLPFSLKSLTLVNAEQLRSLPNLLSSLKFLLIKGCHLELLKKFREFGSPEQNKISNIREVILPDWDTCFIMGKECNDQTFYKLRDKDDSTISYWLSQPEDNGECRNHGF